MQDSAPGGRALSTVAFRCDGGDRVGAGHVARCVQIAAAFRMGGDEPVFVGSFDGLAAALLAAAAMPVREPAPERPAGLPAGVAAAVVDSYALPARELRQAAAAVPLAAILDEPHELGDEVVRVDYHPDARGVPAAGPDYAPVAPACTRARRERGFERALVTVGGGESGCELARRALAACERKGLEAELPGEGGPAPAGLAEPMRRADVAVSAAGVTAYELACAGVPSALVPIAPNQSRVASAFGAAGLALTGDDPERLVGALADGDTRARLAAAGPATIDGYGGFRVRDVLRAALRGEPSPAVLRYRPATPADSELQLAWRDDPATREASRHTAELLPEAHARWYADVLADPLRALLLVEGPHGPCGSVRFDADGDEAEISVIVAPGRRGGGTGTKAIRESSELFLAAQEGIARIRAEVRVGNARSLAAFERAGFRPCGRAAPEGWLVLTLDRAALASASA